MKKRIVLVASLFTFAIPAVAGATIVVNQAMFGVNLGSAMTQVRHQLGRPSEVDRAGGTTTWFYANSGLYVDFRKGRVHDISTMSASQRTASGVGVGSSETAVMKLVPGVQCAPNSQGTDHVECVVASAQVLTKFEITSQRGRVKSVLITHKP